jgi:hypothetical protein
MNENKYKVDLRLVWHGADETPAPQREILIEAWYPIRVDDEKTVIFESLYTPTQREMDATPDFCKRYHIIQWCYLDDIYYRIEP